MWKVQLECKRQTLQTIYQQRLDQFDSPRHRRQQQLPTPSATPGRSFSTAAILDIVPAHLMLCMIFLLLPAGYAARDAYNRRDDAVHSKPLVACLANGSVSLAAQ